MATPSHDVGHCNESFEIFSHQSGLLEDSYRDLKETITGLTLTLRDEHSACLEEIAGREELGRRLSEILETLPDAILVLDPDGVIRQSNSKASELLNQPLIGCSWASIVAREVACGGNEDGNIKLREGRRLGLSRRPMNSESGEVLLLSEIVEGHQISENHQRNERLTAIGEMTAEFAHQVRTPLASAILYAGQLDTTVSAQAHIAGKIIAGLGDLKRMINDMLGFAAGARACHERVNVLQLLHEVRESILGQLSKSATLRVSVTDTELNIVANSDAIRGALLNLVSNADQACNHGANILLHGHCFGDSVHLCVTDDGPGIPREIQPRLFDAFFTTRTQGIGLGLSVVKAIATAHNGEVILNTSELGSSFTIQLPAMTCSSELQ